jgi:uncharacterized protein DUF2752
VGLALTGPRYRVALSVRLTDLDAADLRVAAALLLPSAVVLPHLPGFGADGHGIPCPLRTLTGVPCPLCGMTTSVEAAVRLHLRNAFAANPAGVALVVVAIALLVFRPRTLALPTVALPLVLAAMWLFELHRFGFV